MVVPTFRARTPKTGILAGMNESLVKQELEAIESDQIKGEYVSVGSLEEVTTGGNWPPKYDKGAKKEDKTMTGKPATKVSVDPDMKEKKN